MLTINFYFLLKDETGQVCFILLMLSFEYNNK